MKNDLTSWFHRVPGLPGVKYKLTAVTAAADESDGRAAVLQFSRESDYHGDVGAHPQDAALKPPQVENVS